MHLTFKKKLLYISSILLVFTIYQLFRFTNTVRLESVQPQSGVIRESLDSFELITFVFSDRVNPSNISVTSTPHLDLEIVHSSENPKIIAIKPALIGWEPYIQYEITLANKLSLWGNLLSSDIVHIYQNNIPFNVEIDFPDQETYRLPPI